MKRIEFTKMHGLSNDFVIIDRTVDDAVVINDEEAMAIAMCDRRTGIGADGVLLVERSDVADVRMRVRNADGSVPEMCGNGIRCVCKFVVDHKISKAKPLRIETGRGVLELDYDVDGAGKVTNVTVDMGEPILEMQKIPVELPRQAGDKHLLDFPLDKYIPMKVPAEWMEDCELDKRMTAVSMGNPHLVIYCGNVIGVPLEMIGPFLERQAIFPNRINVHFVQVNDRGDVTMRTWERGSGVTFACGTGASAVCVASAATKRTNRSILAHLPGGDLKLRWDESSNHVFMTGPAEEVFAGTWAAQEKSQQVGRSTSQQVKVESRKAKVEVR